MERLNEAYSQLPGSSSRPIPRRLIAALSAATMLATVALFLTVAPRPHGIVHRLGGPSPRVAAASFEDLEDRLHRRLFESEYDVHAVWAQTEELRTVLSNPVVEAMYEAAIVNAKGAWARSTVADFATYMRVWGSAPQGVADILDFKSFYADNPAAIFFLTRMRSKNEYALNYSPEILDFLKKFIATRKSLMGEGAEGISELTDLIYSA